LWESIPYIAGKDCQANCRNFYSLFENASALARVDVEVEERGIGNLEKPGHSAVQATRKRVNCLPSAALAIIGGASSEASSEKGKLADSHLSS